VTNWSGKEEQMNRTWKASWEIFRCSLELLRREKTLVLFPIFTAVCTVGICLFFLAPVVLQPTGYGYTQAEHWKAVERSVFTADLAAPEPGKAAGHQRAALTDKAAAYLAFIYFGSLFLATFFNTAFASQIFSALQGGPVSIAAGLRFSLGRWREILVWSLFAGVVGMIIRRLEEKFGFIGRFVLRLVGVAWSIASVFAISVIVMEPVTANPVDILRKSAETIKKTWGEALAGYAGMGLGSGLVVLGSLPILAAGGAITYFTGLFWPLAAAAALWLATLVVFSYLSGVAGTVYECGVYLYASTGNPPQIYQREMMELAWKRK
jgi:hypothetical protein